MARLPDLAGAELELARRGLCPDCHNVPLKEGPRGGSSVNRFCPVCGSRFNFLGEYGQLGVERLGGEPERVLLTIGAKTVEATVVVQAADGASLVVFCDDGVGSSGAFSLYRDEHQEWRETVTEDRVFVRHRAQCTPGAECTVVPCIFHVVRFSDYLLQLLQAWKGGSDAAGETVPGNHRRLTLLIDACEDEIRRYWQELKAVGPQAGSARHAVQGMIRRTETMTDHITEVRAFLESGRCPLSKGELHYRFDVDMSSTPILLSTLGTGETLVILFTQEFYSHFPSRVPERDEYQRLQFWARAVYLKIHAMALTLTTPHLAESVVHDLAVSLIMPLMTSQIIRPLINLRGESLMAVCLSPLYPITHARYAPWPVVVVRHYQGVDTFNAHDELVLVVPLPEVQQ